MPYTQHMSHGYATTEAIVALEDDRDAYAEYIREITGDGDSIVECLISIMDDPGAKPYEKLDAQLVLDSIGYGRFAVEQAEDADALPQPDNPDPPRTANPRRPRRPAFTLSEETLFHLPALVREKTGNGKKMADFLNDAINGNIPDFKSRHRIRAAKQLTARAYSRDRDPNYGLGEIDPDSTMRLIQTLTAGIKERRAREEREKALQPPPSLIDVLQPPVNAANATRTPAPDSPLATATQYSLPHLLQRPHLRVRVLRRRTRAPRSQSRARPDDERALPPLPGRRPPMTLTPS